MSTKTLTMLAVGDITPGTPAKPQFALVAPTLRSADVVVGQGEVPFTLRGVTTYITFMVPPVGPADIMASGLEESALNAWLAQTSDTPAPRGGRDIDPSEIGATLSDAGFSVIHVAGNHTFDKGIPGIEDTIAGLREYGIACIGSGMNIDEAKRPAIIERDGTRFGFLSYNCVGRIGQWATPDKPGCAYVHIITAYEQYSLMGGAYPAIYTFAEPSSLQSMVDDIHKLRPLCDVLTVHFHKGLALVPVRLAMYEKQISHAAIDAGADLILGDHAHILKGIEQYKGKWIFHNLGDFITPSSSGARFNPERQAQLIRDHGGPFFFGPGHKAVPFPNCPEMKMTIIAKFTINNGQISQVSYLPCLPNEQNQVEILKNNERGQQVFDYMDNATKGVGLNARYEWRGDEVLIHAE